jgi:putative ABC transport system permease protein
MWWWRQTQLAFHLLKKEKARLMVAIIGIAFADILIFMQLGFKGALFASTSALQERLTGDLFVIHPFFETLIAPQSIERDLFNRCLAHPNVGRVQGVKVGLVPWRNPVNGRTRSIQVLGFDPTFPALSDKVPKGAGPQPTADDYARLRVLGNLLFDRSARPEFGPIEELAKAGDGTVEAEINRRKVKVVGFFYLGASFAADGSVITSLETYSKIFPDSKSKEIEYGMVFLKDRSLSEQTLADLQMLIGKRADVVNHSAMELRERTYWENATAIGYIFNFGSVMGFVVGVVIVYQILHSGIENHLSQYATLKAMGYGNLFLFRTLVQESCMLAVAGFLPGLGVCVFLYGKVATATLLPLEMTAERAGIVLGATVTMCLISAVLASRTLFSADPADIF